MTGKEVESGTGRAHPAEPALHRQRTGFSQPSLTANRAAAREQAIRELEKRSVVKSVLDVRADDQLLLLVTCLDGDTERLVVAAQRLRDGEKALSPAA